MSLLSGIGDCSKLYVNVGVGKGLQDYELLSPALDALL